MAKVTKWALFWRAFFLTIISGSPSQAADQAETEVWNNAISSKTPDAYYYYLSLYPAGEFVEEAVGALVEMGAVSTRDISPGLVETNRTRTRQPSTPGVYE